MSEQSSRVRLGDVIEIPLPNSRKGYAQFVFFDPRIGYMIQVYDLIAAERPALNQVQAAKPRFRPMFAPLVGAVKAKIWTIIGNLPVEAFEYPPFLSPPIPGGNWTLSTPDGRGFKIGRDLPDEYKNFEILVIWQPGDIVERIQTGKTSLDLYFRR